jgi:hypothetical protein
MHQTQHLQLLGFTTVSVQNTVLFVKTCELYVASQICSYWPDEFVREMSHLTKYRKILIFSSFFQGYKTRIPWGCILLSSGKEHEKTDNVRFCKSDRSNSDYFNCNLF